MFPYHHDASVTLPGQFRTEAHVFQATNGVLPTSLALSERIRYEDNVGVNLAWSNR